MENITMVPRQITVKVIRDVSGVYIAELPDYNAHTEAETIHELYFQVNDLIYGIFDIASEHRKDIKYAPESDSKPSKSLSSNVFFKKYITPDAARTFC